tara:strand:- start:7886 stop:9043 length:1158 start_codon:yes stop_codon:yes gene_type:complete
MQVSPALSSASVVTNPQDVYTDLNSLQGIRTLGKEDKSAALMEVARQFESMFMNMMLSSMRQANAVFSEDSLMGSSEGDFYQGMYDNQLALQMSGQQASGSGASGRGLADIIHQQLMSNFGDAGDAPELDQAKLFDRRVASVPLREALAEVDRVLQQGDAAAVTRREPVSQASVLSPESLSKTLASVASGSGSKGQQFASADEFVAALYPHAAVIGAELGVDPRAIVAQAALETGWGKHMIADAKGNNSFNFFGIKADQRWQGEAVDVTTHEYRYGTRVKETASFRSYASLEDGLRDYADFLAGSERYQQALGKGLDGDEYGYALQQAGYATDPEYGAKIRRIARSETLQGQGEVQQPSPDIGPDSSKAAEVDKNKDRPSVSGGE